MLEPNFILRDRYQIIRLLGQGGMGAVYEALDSVFDSTVAVKEIVVDLSNANNTKAQEMVHAAFEREAKLLAKINHETFPHVKDYFSFDNKQFLVMELVDGEDLAKLLKDRESPFPASDVTGWADQLLDGLDYLHNQTPPIIHRDLKPQNLKLNSRGKIKLLDFGIAKGTDSTNANTITDQTFVAATLNYSPIEQMLRVIDPTFLAVITHKYNEQVEPLLAQNADTRSDIYALGATIYNLLTATSPVEAVKRGVDVWDGKPDPLQSPHTLNAAISEGLSNWILKSMQIRREERFSSAAEMRDALKNISIGTTQQSTQKTEVMNFAPVSTQPNVPPQSTVPPPQIENEPNSVETIAAPRNIVSTGQPQSSAVVTGGASSNTAQPADEKKRSYKILWLIPVFAILFGMLGVGGLGAWWFLRNRDTGVTSGNTNSYNVDNTNVTTVSDSTNSRGDDDPTPEASPSVDISLDSNVNSEPSPTEEESPRPTTTVKSTPRKTPIKRATPRPTIKRTPRRTPRRKPTPKKKNMNCIFTDDC